MELLEKPYTGYKELELVRLRHGELIRSIPRDLLEQIPQMDSMMIEAVFQNADKIAQSENTWFFVIRKRDHDSYGIVGVLWLLADVIERHVFVFLCSVIPEYQGVNWQLEKWIAGIIFSLDIPENYKDRIQWATTRPEIFVKAGARRSEKVLVEITREAFERDYT